jgi:dolichol-phosphate mannosyltransferase
LPVSLSFVVPVLNEEGSLRQLQEEIRQTAEPAGWDWEVLYIDDGSNDGTWYTIQSLAEGDSRVKGVRLRRNFGKAAALAAGFRQARGEYVATLDGDLQDDPAEVPKLFNELHSRRLDLVSGWKKTRHDPWHKVIPSRVFNWLVRVLTRAKLHDHNCGLKLYRREVCQEVRLYGERHRFVPVLAAAKGFKIGEVVVQHRPRKYGKSKYGASRFVRGFLDLLTVCFLTSYSHRPQHLLGIAGMLFAFLGVLGMGYMAIDWVINTGKPGHIPLHQRPLLIYSLAGLLLGVQLFTMGLLAELVTAHGSTGEEPYCIAETTPSPSSSGKMP